MVDFRRSFEIPKRMSGFISWLKSLFGLSNRSGDSSKKSEETNQKEDEPEKKDSTEESTETNVEQQVNGCLPTNDNDDLNQDNANETLQEKAEEIDFDSAPEFVRKIRTKAAKKDQKPVFGLTVLNHQLFVITQFSKEIEVYDSKSLSFLRHLSIDGLFDPIDIAACHVNDCLFVFDCIDVDSGEMLRIDPNGTLINRWSTGADTGFISVSRDGHVILSVWKRNVLMEYSADGQRTREIHLPAGIENLRSGVELSDSEFVVSHGEEDDDDHRVCLVDGNGTLASVIGAKQGMSDGRFNSPNYLAVDRSSKSVFVADQNNKRVVLLGPQLSFKRELIQEADGLRYPVRLALDGQRLFVADANCSMENNEFKWTDGCVNVFDFKLRQTTN